MNGNLFGKAKEWQKKPKALSEAEKSAAKSAPPRIKLSVEPRGSRVSDEIQWNSEAVESAAIKALARQLAAFIVKLPLKIERSRTELKRNAKRGENFIIKVNRKPRKSVLKTSQKCEKATQATSYKLQTTRNSVKPSRSQQLEN